MQDLKEKRHYQRVDHQCPIHFYRIDDQDQPFPAEMSDYSEGGMSMKTREKLVIGHLVYLEMENGPEQQNSHFGTIRWTAPDPSYDAGALYMYGIEYSDTPKVF